MKSVLFVSYSMGIGGVEKALLGVVNKFTSDNWDVDIALIKPEGEFLNYLPSTVKILQIDSFEIIRPLIHTPMRESIESYLKQRKIIEAVIIGACLVFYKFNKGAKKLYDYAFRNIPPLNDKQYDLAIAFAGPDAFIDTYVDKCVNAKEKWGWVHFDISKFGIDKSIIRKTYSKYSRINIVSEQAKTIFEQQFPQFKSKTILSPNIIDQNSILRMAEEKIIFPHNPNKKIFLTVGRVAREKGQYKVLEAIKSLVKKNIIDFQWWFVGNGTDMERCVDFVTSNGLDDYVCFLGSTPNPYPYMKYCDIYVQPSEHEGFCITLAEAKLFNKPIITTDFTGAREQLKNYIHPNLIVNYSSEAIGEAIGQFLHN